MRSSPTEAQIHYRKVLQSNTNRHVVERTHAPAVAALCALAPPRSRRYRTKLIAFPHLLIFALSSPNSQHWPKSAPTLPHPSPPPSFKTRAATHSHAGASSRIQGAHRGRWTCAAPHLPHLSFLSHPRSLFLQTLTVSRPCSRRRHSRGRNSRFHSQGKSLLIMVYDLFILVHTLYSFI